MKTPALLTTLVLVLGCSGSSNVAPEQPPAAPTAASPAPAPAGQRADVGGLAMYYEIHGGGAGDPLVLLHGGLTTIDLSFGSILPALATGRRVIAIEQQGHGHTADVDRPLGYPQMADDTAALLAHLDIERADVLGYSDGGVVALELAIRHPALVGKLVLVETGFSNDGLDPQMLAWLAQARPEDFAELQPLYAAVAPEPAHWPVLFEKWKQLQLGFEGLPKEALGKVEAPALVLAADQGVRAEHTVELFRLLPRARLAVVPDSDHFLLQKRPELVLALVTPFLDGASAPRAKSD